MLWPRQPVGGQTGRWGTGFISCTTTSSQLASVLQPPATQCYSSFPIPVSLRPSSPKPRLVPIPKPVEGRLQQGKQATPSALIRSNPSINGVDSSPDNPNQSFSTNYRALTWVRSKSSRLLLPRACKQTVPLHYPVVAKGGADSRDSGSTIHPCDHVHIRTSVSKGSFLRNSVSRDCSAIVRAENPQQCADRSPSHGSLFRAPSEPSLRADVLLHKSASSDCSRIARLVGNSDRWFIFFLLCFDANVRLNFGWPGRVRAIPEEAKRLPGGSLGLNLELWGGNFWKGGGIKKASLQYIGWMTGFQSVVAVCFTGNLSCDKVGWVSGRLQESKNTPEKIRFDGCLLERCTLLLSQKSTRDLKII